MILGINGIIAGKGAVSIDSDAQAFITAANITDTTQKSAIIQLVSDLKSANIWTKMKAIYPFVGGTASSHKLNLKDPRDSNLAFRLNLYGGVTHSSNGIHFDGATGGADTFFNPYLNQAKNNLHLSIYARIRTANRSRYSNDINPYANYTVDGWTSLRATSEDITKFTGFGNSDNSQGYVGIDNDFSVGFALGSRTSSTLIKFYKNTTSVSGNGANHTADFINTNLVLNGSLWSIASLANYAFASIGDGLSDSEATAFYNAVQTFNTTLSRQV